MERSGSMALHALSVPAVGRLEKAIFLRFSISLLAILAATVCNLELRVVKSVPDEEKRIVTKATMTKRAIRISIRENPGDFLCFVLCIMYSVLCINFPLILNTLYKILNR